MYHCLLILKLHVQCISSKNIFHVSFVLKKLTVDFLIDNLLINVSDIVAFVLLQPKTALAQKPAIISLARHVITQKLQAQQRKQQLVITGSSLIKTKVQV